MPIEPDTGEIKDKIKYSLICDIDCSLNYYQEYYNFEGGFIYILSKKLNR